MAAVTYTLPTSQVFDPWLSGQHWASARLSYSFAAQPGTGTGFLSHDQRNTVRAALDDIAGFTRLEFVEYTGSQGASATLRYVSDRQVEGAYAYTPSAGGSGGDAFFGAGSSRPRLGNEAYALFLHEIGHTMGLEHGHEFRRFVQSGLDSQEYTVVTYSDHVGDTKPFSFDSGATSWAQSFMQLDIAAMQYLYGANYASSGAVWSGNTTYRFNPATGEMSINGIGQGVPVGNKIFRTIWDGHGRDTYDLRNYKTDLDVDLAPGTWSTVSTAQLADLNRKSPSKAFLAEGNFANALLVEGDRRGLIENAIGGDGGDALKGNQAANTLRGRGGDDTLAGRSGDDRLFGGSGADRLFGGGGEDDLRGGQGRDVLRGGDSPDRGYGLAGNDRLFAGTGNDRMDGGSGNDLVSGGSGNDRLWGQAGSDVLNGGVGRDVLRGGANGDRLSGGGGDDILKGGLGGDVLIGGPGTDKLVGGGGDDVFRFARISDSPAGSSPDRIEDFGRGEDRIDLSDLTGSALAFGGRGGSGPNVSTRKVSGDTRVTVDTDGDGRTEFHVLVVGYSGLSADDFVL